METLAARFSKPTTGVNLPGVSPDRTGAGAAGLKALGRGLSPAASGVSRAAQGLTSDPLAARQNEFADVLTRRREAVGKGTPEERARDAASDFVAAAFIEPLLKQLRQNDNSPPPFAPGPGEKQFRGLMDAQLSRRIARAAHFPLVDSVARDLLKKPRGQAAPERPEPDRAGLNTFPRAGGAIDVNAR